MKTLKDIFTNRRVKSFMWRTGAMALAMVIGAVSSNIDMFAPYISPLTMGILGLVLGEITKALNDFLSGK